MIEYLIIAVFIIFTIFIVKSLTSKKEIKEVYNFYEIFDRNKNYKDQVCYNNALKISEKLDLFEFSVIGVEFFENYIKVYHDPHIGLPVSITYYGNKYSVDCKGLQNIEKMVHNLIKR